MNLIRITEMEYNDIKALRQSYAKELLKSPAHYVAAVDAPEKDTPALFFGRLAHLMMLEPARVSAEVAVSPECDRRTTAGKKMYAAFMEAAEGKTIVTPKDMAQAEAMRDAIADNYSTAARLLSADGPVEQPIVFNWLGVECKCRLDKIADGIAIVDYKTTMDASPEGFRWWKWLYHFQAAWYTEAAKSIGYDNLPFVFVAQEKVPPYAVGVYSMPLDAVQIGRQLCEQAIETYKRCVDSGEWHGYADEVVELQVPSWMSAAAVDVDEEVQF